MRLDVNNADAGMEIPQNVNSSAGKNPIFENQIAARSLPFSNRITSRQGLVFGLFFVLICDITRPRDRRDFVN